MLLDAWAEAGPGDYDAEIIYELARGVHEISDGEMFEAVRGAIEELTGEEGAEYYVGLLGVAEQNKIAREVQQHEQHEQTRVEHVHGQLTDEYRTIEETLGPAGLEAANEIAQQVNEAGLLYDPDVDPEQVRVALLAAAGGQGTGYTGNVFETVEAIGQEMKRTYGPAGDDASRERWEQKMDDASVEIAERAHQFADPDEAAFRALRSRALERADTSPLEAMLDQEIANIANTHPRLSTGKTYTRRTPPLGIDA